MANDKKQSTIDALNKYSQRCLDEAKPKELKRHNAKPEKEVEKACLEWMRGMGWSVNIFEAKANWNGRAWVQQAMRQGTVDCLGNTADGVSVAIEFKAPNCLSTFNSDRRYLQRKFVVDKINTNSFACVVDSVERLKTIYEKWMEISALDKNAARQYLISMLPVVSDRKKVSDSTLFPDE